LALAVTVASILRTGLKAQESTKGAAARQAAATRPWNPPLTPDGHPDFQGVWVNNSATPLERPKSLEGRVSLTDEEVAALRNRAARFRENDSDFAGGDNLYLAALSGVEKYKSAVATGGADAEADREFENRTSLIVDPPDGKIPFTLEGQRRQSTSAEV